MLIIFIPESYESPLWLRFHAFINRILGDFPTHDWKHDICNKKLQKRERREIPEVEGCCDQIDICQDLVQTLSLSGPGANIIIIWTWCKHYHYQDLVQTLSWHCYKTIMIPVRTWGPILFGAAILTLTNDTICQTRASLQCNLRLSRHGAFHCHTHM